jgi:hypothetical protein
VTGSDDRAVSLSILPGSYNVVREPLRGVACWRLGDGAFGFDDTFIGLGARKDFREFARIWAKHPRSKVALFGHTDIAGKEKYNHDLGAGRARTVYGVMRNDPEIWYEMFQSDKDALASVKKRLRAGGHEIPLDEKGLGDATRTAIRAHVSKLAGELALDPTDFLGEHGQYSMQSCSEFNALRRISAELDATLDATQRDEFERANRRVLAFLFAPGTHVDGRWPCPRPGDGVGGCKPRFWSDAAARRAVTTVARQFVPDGVTGGPLFPVVEAKDTFACRFYDRIAHKSACERSDPWIPPEEVIIIEEEEEEDDKGGGTDPVVEMERVVLTCAHPNRYNSGYLKKTPPTDRIEIVPEDEEIVTAQTEPRANATWTLPGEGPTVAERVLVPIGQVVPSGDLGFFELKNVNPEVHVVTAVHGSSAQTVEIHAYPFDPYESDFDKLLEVVRKAFWLQIKAWKVIGEVIPSIDHIEIDLLDPAKCSSHVYGAWREAPTDHPDYKAFFAFDVGLDGKPLLGVNAAMEASLANLLKKTQIDEKKVPPWLKKVLKAAKLSGELVGNINGPLGLKCEHPGRIEATPGTGSLEYKGRFVIKPKNLIKLDILEDLHGEVALNFVLDAEFALEMSDAELVLSLSGRIASSSFRVIIGDDPLVELEPFPEWELDPIRVAIPLPSAAT